MSSRFKTTLMISLCMTSGLLPACDAPDDDLDAALDADLADLEARELDAADELSAVPQAMEGQGNHSEKLAEAWVKWAYGLPATTGPLFDLTGASCGMAQDGPVWFLAGTSGGSATRQCTIPHGKKLFFPLLNSNWPLFDGEAEDEELVAARVAYFDGLIDHTCALTLRVDGEDVVEGGLDEMVEELWVENYEPFEMTIDGEWLGGSTGLYDMMGAGYYARIHPLTPGDHVVELGGRFCDGEQTWFETSVTYELHIGG